MEVVRRHVKCAAIRLRSPTTRWKGGESRGRPRLVKTQLVKNVLASLNLGGAVHMHFFHLMLASSLIPQNIATRLIRVCCAQREGIAQVRSNAQGVHCFEN
jgi:hypothetical protein